METKSVGLLVLETAVLECFLEKTPLSPLGVNVNGRKEGSSRACWKGSHCGIWMVKSKCVGGCVWYKCCNEKVMVKCQLQCR
jgi:hypothetical protein